MAEELMDGVPQLSPHDLRADLEEAYRSKRHHHLFAYFGTGEEGVLKLANAAEFRVVPVRSELELRERLPPLEDEEARVAFLVPWTEDIPLDLAGRFALGGRVRRIGREARLRQLFGVAEIDDRALRSPLAEHLLSKASERRYAVGDGRLTVDAMWDTWLAAEWKVPTSGGLALDTLLGFAAVDRRGPQVAEKLDPALSDAIEEHLRRRLGAAGPIVWRAWLEARGSVVLEHALVFESLADHPHAAAPVWIRARVRHHLGVPRDAEALEVARALGREAAGALRYVERASGAGEVRALARAADAHVDDEDVRALLRESTRLPLAWSARLDALGEALERGARTPDAERLTEAVRALRALESHVFFKDSEQSARLLRAEMAVRLLAWLTVRSDRRVEPSPTPQGDAEALGRWYAEEGGYVDGARKLARDATDGALGRGVQAVVAAADAARTELDRRFAKSLVAWVEAGQPRTQVLPIQDAVQRIACRFLDEEPNRKLLVLLLDGMAWAQAVQLLESLGGRSAPWGPLAWHSTKHGRVGEALHPVVFAALPTITEVSRTSFFAGKVPKSGSRLDTSKDPDVWAAHPGVKKYAIGTDVPRLLLRSEGHTKGGGASNEALSLVADDTRRVVALVLNAIDDSLKASHALRASWTVDSIASLPELLDKAREHGRSVLLASDHGHVPAGRFEKVRAPHPGIDGGGGARWRPLKKRDAPVADDEVAFFGPHVNVPKDHEGIALLADDASVYAGNTHAGEHGGATLAEVVAPCLLVGCEDGATFSGDTGLAVRAAFVPPWWHFDVREDLVPTELAAEPPRTKKKPDERQLGLPTIATPKTKSVPPTPKPSQTSPLTRSAVLSACVPNESARQEVVRAVETILARGSVMSANAFAAEMNVLAFRVAGFISKLQEVLNLDGYEVVRFDPQTRQVFVDREKLQRLFLAEDS